MFSFLRRPLNGSNNSPARRANAKAKENENARRANSKAKENENARRVTANANRTRSNKIYKLSPQELNTKYLRMTGKYKKLYNEYQRLIEDYIQDSPQKTSSLKYKSKDITTRYMSNANKTNYIL